ncbi:MAG: 2Fe-2S iron-sulfur cluster binding domain-containing protein [Candidatus Kapabacteria bacterium]|nr:2Fe-2S iron-sulfur cluster binding domain-containing protein [Candidatus Kapabacteria bacterium]
MAVTFHSLTVASVARPTDESVAISFRVAEADRSAFSFVPGQYLTVKAVIDGVEQRRNYSICSSPRGDEPLTIGVKRVANGAMSQYLNDHVKPGDMLELYPPMGSFTIDVDTPSADPIVLYAGGSGITPILSMLKSILDAQPNRSVTLIYANRNERSIMFADVIDGLALAHPDRFRQLHVLEDNATATRTSYAGLLDADMAAMLLSSVTSDAAACQHYICGPQGMMEAVGRALHQLAVPESNIHREYFTISTHKSQPMNHEETQPDGATAERKTRSVTIRLYGTESTFDVDPDETILTAAQRANLDPPFACQIGACCTCRAKLLSGRVIMDEREALSDDEIDEGYILTCQSHPITDDVVADYDQ